MRTILTAAALALAATAATAQGLQRVTDRAAFLGLVQGQDLTSVGVRLVVGADGSIGGRAFGADVVGTWTWEGGYFCRSMQAGGREFPRNCQEVQAGGDRIRFVADRGAGDTANLRIQ